MQIKDPRITGGIVLVLVAIQLYQHPTLDLKAAFDSAFTIVSMLLGIITLGPGQVTKEDGKKPPVS